MVWVVCGSLTATLFGGVAGPGPPMNGSPVPANGFGSPMNGIWKPDDWAPRVCGFVNALKIFNGLIIANAPPGWVAWKKLLAVLNGKSTIVAVKLPTCCPNDCDPGFVTDDPAGCPNIPFAKFNGAEAIVDIGSTVAANALHVNWKFILKITDLFFCEWSEGYIFKAIQKQNFIHFNLQTIKQ